MSAYQYISTALLASMHDRAEERGSWDIAQQMAAELANRGAAKIRRALADQDRYRKRVNSPIPYTLTPAAYAVLVDEHGPVGAVPPAALLPAFEPCPSCRPYGACQGYDPAACRANRGSEP